MTKISIQSNQVKKMFEVVKASSLMEKKSKPIDLFIACCGFEKRCLTAINSLPIETINEALILMNDEAPSESKVNLEEFKTVLGNKIKLVEVPLFNPLQVADTLIHEINCLCGTRKKLHFLVDITSFTHEVLLIFLAISKLFYQDHNIEYIYNNASVYASESPTDSQRWLSRGILEVRSVLGYAGDFKPSQETVLVMMVGYECERAMRVIETVAPEELIITYNDAESSTDQTNREASTSHATWLRNLAAYYQNLEPKIIPSNNPFKAAEKLEEVLAHVDQSKNIIIAPMNNKLSTVGAALVAFKRPEIQLCYAPASYYNTSSYSEVGEDCYVFTLD